MKSATAITVLRHRVLQWSKLLLNCHLPIP